MENRRFTNMNNLPPTPNEEEVDARIDRLHNDMWTQPESQLDSVKEQMAAEQSMRDYLDARPNGGHRVEQFEEAEKSSPLEVGLFEGDVFYAAGQEGRSGKVVAVESTRDLKGESVYVVSTTLEVNGSEQHEVMTEAELRSYLKGMDLVDGGHGRAEAENGDLEPSTPEVVSAEVSADSAGQEAEVEQVNESEESHEDEAGETGPKGRRKRSTRGDGRKIGGKNGQPGEQDVVGVDSESNVSSEDDTPAAEANAAQSRDTGNVAAESAAVPSHESSTPEQSAGASEAASAPAAFVVGGNGVAERRTDGDSSNAAEQGADSSATPEEAAASVEEDGAATPSGSARFAIGGNGDVVDRSKATDSAERTPDGSTVSSAAAHAEAAPKTFSKELVVIEGPQSPEDILKGTDNLERAMDEARAEADKYQEEAKNKKGFRKWFSTMRDRLKGFAGKAGANTVVLAGEARNMNEARRRNKTLMYAVGAVGVVAAGLGAYMLYKSGGDNPFTGDTLSADPERGTRALDSLPGYDANNGVSNGPNLEGLDFDIEAGQGGYEAFRNVGLDEQTWDAHKDVLLQNFPDDFYRMNSTTGEVGLAKPGELSQGAKEYIARLKNGS